MTDYYKDHRFSASAAKKLSSGLSPYAAFWALRNPTPPTAAMGLGTTVHAIIEHGGSCPDEIAVVSPFPDFRTKAAKEWKAEQVGVVLKQSEMDQAFAMAENIMNTVDTLSGDHEVELYDDHRKARIDYIHGDTVYDWKTTQRTTLRDVKFDCYKYGLDIQAAHYLRMTGCKKFLFVFVSSAEPYETFVVEAGPTFLADGEDKLDLAFALWLRYHDAPLDTIPKSERLILGDVEGF